MHTLARSKTATNVHRFLILLGLSLAAWCCWWLGATSTTMSGVLGWSIGATYATALFAYLVYRLVSKLLSGYQQSVHLVLAPQSARWRENGRAFQARVAAEMRGPVSFRKPPPR